jgi:hypothetical protein
MKGKIDAALTLGILYASLLVALGYTMVDPNVTGGGRIGCLLFGIFMTGFAMLLRNGIVEAAENDLRSAHDDDSDSDGLFVSEEE